MRHKRVTRHKRRNADDKLRKLERAAASGDPGDVVAYWRACIKAGVIPEPNYIIGNDFAWVYAPDIEAYRRSGYGQGGQTLRLIYYPADSFSGAIAGNEFCAIRGADGMPETITGDILDGLARLVELYEAEGTRSNPDDDIRRLERQAFASEDPSDIVAYWRACIRAGETPKSNFINEIYNYHIWTFGVADYKKQISSVPRVVQFDDQEGIAVVEHYDVVGSFPTVNQALEALIELGARYGL